MQARINGVETRFEITGDRDAPLVLLANSLGADLSMWDRQAAALAAEGFQVLRYDARGHGGTEASAPPYSMEDLADDQRSFLDEVGAERAHVVGLSLGAMAALVLTLKHPGRVRSLVLADTTSGYPPEVRAVWGERIAAVEAGGVMAILEGTLGRWFTPGFRDRDPETFARIRAGILATTAKGYVGCCHAIRGYDVSARLGEIRCPTLVMVGAEDAATTPAMAEALSRAIPGADLQVLPAAAHLSCVEQPDAFNGHLLDFLARQTTGADPGAGR